MTTANRASARLDGTKRGAGPREHDRIRRRLPSRSAIAILTLSVATPAVRANTFTVTTTADSGAGSLRKAIQDANARSGTDTIDFNLSGTGPFVIKPATRLPTLTGKVTLDATTQPGWIAAPLVEIDGSQLSGTDGLAVAASGTTIRGLAIHSFDAGIAVSSSSVVVEDCWIGLDAFGASSRPNDEGIYIGATGARIARNVICSSVNHGVWVLASNATIEDNVIGLDPTGTFAIGSRDGISFALGVDNGLARRNVIAGNRQHGVIVTDGGTSNHSILDNWIGTGSDLVTPIGNGAHGIHVINGDSSLIQGNVITANGSAGIRVELNNGSSTQARKNRITLNSISRNGGMGIDIGPAWTNGIDALDADTGANELQNAPRLLRAVNDPRGLHLWGELHSLPATTFQIEIFGCTTADAEGEVLLATFPLTTNAAGDASFYSLLASWPFGLPVSATATDPAGNTSEFGSVYVLPPPSRDLNPGGPPVEKK